MELYQYNLYFISLLLSTCHERTAEIKYRFLYFLIKKKNFPCVLHLLQENFPPHSLTSCLIALAVMSEGGFLSLRRWKRGHTTTIIFLGVYFYFPLPLAKKKKEKKFPWLFPNVQIEKYYTHAVTGKNIMKQEYYWFFRIWKYSRNLLYGWVSEGKNNGGQSLHNPQILLLRKIDDITLYFSSLSLTWLPIVCVHEIKLYEEKKNKII